MRPATPTTRPIRGRRASLGLPVLALPALALLTVLALAACGKKPIFVDPPEDVDPDPFPRTYPST